MKFTQMRKVKSTQGNFVCQSVMFSIKSATLRGVVLAAVFLPAFVSFGGERLRPNYSPIVPGLDYVHIPMTNWNNNSEPWSIHIARLDRSQKDLHLESSLAHGQVFGTAPVSAIAKSFPKEWGEPLVAINTGFCINKKHPYLGAPRGIGKDADASMVITDGELISAPSKCSFWVNEDGSMHFGRFDSRFKATLSDGTSFSIGLNNECKTNAVMLFTHMLGKNTRATNNLELILEASDQKSLSWHVGDSYTLRIKALNPAGNSALSNKIAVLGFGSEMAAKAGRLQPGDSIKLELKTSPELSRVVTACHAIFPVVEKGKPLEKFEGSTAILRRNPRTAIGFNDRYFFMVVVDGRQKELSMGMNARELAEFMAELGCTEAMNLDGGGSSTFWLDGKTRNSVPGGRERSRSDALIIARRSGGKLVGAASGR